MLTGHEASNLDARGKRKSSPSADLIYSHKIHNIEDPTGEREAKINKTAKRYLRAQKAGNISRSKLLREQLAVQCMNFFYVVGDNISVRENGIKHEGSYAQVDGIFIVAITDTLDNFDSSKGEFTHMLRNQFANRRKQQADDAITYDTRYGGSASGAPISMNVRISKNDDLSSTLENMISRKSEGEDEGEYEESFAFENEELGQETVNILTALDEGNYFSHRGSEDTPLKQAAKAEAAEDLLLLRTLSLIMSFLGKTDRAANETRKLYTKMFFSETLSRMTKVRTEGELAPLQKQEKNLFKAVELPFQDSYTVAACRTIIELWQVAFIAGVPEPKRPFNDNPKKFDKAPQYNWTLAASVFISYLRSLGKPASDALVSQQRKHFEELLQELRPRK